MTRVLHVFTRAGKASRLVGASLITAAGIFYIMHPPRTTSSFFDGEWPPILWGIVMLAAGMVTAIGIRTQILQVEQYGMQMVAVGTLILATAQTMVMVSPDFTPTRGGGVLVIWAIVAFSIARYFELSRDIRSARIAKQRMKEGHA